MIPAENTTPANDQTLYSLLLKPWQWLLDALFPKRCLGCGRFGSWCCPACLATLTYQRQLPCPNCGHKTPLGEFCSDCCLGRSLNGVWSAQPYGNRVVRNMIRELKFNGLTEVVTTLVQLMIGLMRAYSLPPAWHQVAGGEWRLTPVPLNPRRQRQRNFNQAEILARQLAAATGLTYQSTLKRIRSTKPQSEIKTDLARETNVHGAFALEPKADIAGRAFILVDDVYTSGSTMEECARLLKAAGAAAVWGLTVAKG